MNNSEKNGIISGTKAIIKQKENEDIKNGKISLEINEEKQNAHNKNSDKYKEGRSYFTISLKEEQELVYKHATKGYTPLTRNGNIKNKEICTTDKVIGTYINSELDNINEKTNSFVIHYSTTNKWVHIVPASNNSICKNEGDDKEWHIYNLCKNTNIFTRKM